MLSPSTIKRLSSVDPLSDYQSSKNELLGSKSITIEQQKTDSWSLSHSIEDGIERVVVKPSIPSKRPALVMQHGMWHSASCWRDWQIWLAECGWESHAHSLPGHGRSPEQRTVPECSLAYYLRFLADEIQRHDTPPILMGHSMGGALTQWYLKYVGPLPAMVLVASWTSHDILKDSLWNAMKIDPLGTCLSPFLGWRFQFRNDQVVRKWFFTKGNDEAAQKLRPELGPESEIVLMQHRAPIWTPPAAGSMPMLWLGAEEDAIIPDAASRRAAKHYGADYLSIPDAGHDLMLEQNAQQSALQIDTWLQKTLDL